MSDNKKVKCDSCGIDTPQVIAQASFKEIRDALAERYGVKPSNVAVRAWLIVVGKLRGGRGSTCRVHFVMGNQSRIEKCKHLEV